MLDLETLGTRPGSAIRAIGAVKFDGEKITSEFYQRIDLRSCVAHGLVIDASTVLWWLGQSDAARHEFTRSGVALSVGLELFRVWIEDADAQVWGNGAAFDNALLAEAYARLDQRTPWKFTNDRCYRTLKALYPVADFVGVGTHHHALDDARSQALHLIGIRKRLQWAAALPVAA